MALSLLYAAGSDVGVVRDNNEDSAYASDRLLVVADGMGGLPFGEVASTVVLERMRTLEEPDAPETDPLDRLAALAGGANARLAEMIAERPELAGMGTTLTAAWVVGERIAVLHVGDSRLYRLRGAELAQMTRDQTAIQDLVDEGLVHPGDVRTHPMRSMLNQAVDGRSDLVVAPGWADLVAGDRVLVCSDGVSDYVGAAELARLLSAVPLDEVVEALTAAAIADGSTDNITAVVADVVDGPVPPQTPLLLLGAA